MPPGQGRTQYNVANPLAGFHIAPSAANYIQSVDERTAALTQQFANQQDHIAIYNGPGKISCLSALAQSIAQKGQGDNSRYYKDKSGPAPFLESHLKHDFLFVQRQCLSNVDASDYELIRSGDYWSCNLRDFESYTGSSTGGKVKGKHKDPRPVRGFGTLTVQLDKPYVACLGRLHGK